MIRLIRSSFLPIIQWQSQTAVLMNINSSRCGVKCVRFYSNSFDVNAWVDTLDEAQQKRVRFIQNELTLQLVENKPVPKLENWNKSDYEHILALSSNQRHKYYNFLFKTHNSESADLHKRELRKLITEAKRESGTISDQKTEHIQYGLGKGALIPKIYNRTIDKWKNNKALWRVMLDDPKLIFDLGYSSEMNFRENTEAASQLSHCFALNRNHRTPFVLHYCNVDFNSVLWKKLHRYIPTLTKKPLPLQIHQQDVLELFPKDKIVILTPDSPNVLREYNPEDCYVVSGIVDRGDRVPYSLAKAKKYDIRTARLPLDSYRTVRVNKTLTLDQVLSVMLEIKFSGDWNQAFRYVASRKFF